MRRFDLSQVSGSVVGWKKFESSGRGGSSDCSISGIKSRRGKFNTWSIPLAHRLLSSFSFDCNSTIIFWYTQTHQRMSCPIFVHNLDNLRSIFVIKSRPPSTSCHLTALFSLLGSRGFLFS